ncbi:hypothetical protein AB0C84_42985 [Actinomadura sp. NPDC048955]|uniref:hypothetical protein n=1 Tax=Actinomadura sp. NPDC048955 TaxID=3158228 RepID=UPI0033E2A6E9
MPQGKAFLSARTRAAICDVAEALGAETFLRVITGEGLPLPAVRTQLVNPDVEPSKIALGLQILASLADVQEQRPYVKIPADWPSGASNTWTGGRLQ